MEVNWLTMEKFKKDLAAKMFILWGAALFGNAVYWVFSAIKENAGDYTRGFGFGLCAVLIAYAAVTSFRLYIIQTDEKKLKELYRKSTDERYVLIREKTASGSFTVSTLIISLSAIFFSFISEEITMVLACVIAVMAVCKLCFKFYYDRKY